MAPRGARCSCRSPSRFADVASVGRLRRQPRVTNRGIARPGRLGRALDGGRRSGRPATPPRPLSPTALRATRCRGARTPAAGDPRQSLSRSPALRRSRRSSGLRPRASRSPARGSSASGRSPGAWRRSMGSRRAAARIAATSSGIGAVLSTSAAAPRRCAAAAYSACANAVSTTTAGRRPASRWRSRSSKPVSRPRRMSRSSTSTSAGSRSGSARPSDAAVPAISIPGYSRSSAAMPSRTTGWSSTIATRIGRGSAVTWPRPERPRPPGCGTGRPDDADPRPAFGPIGDRQLGPELRGALRHRQEPEVPGLAGRARAPSLRQRRESSTSSSARPDSARRRTVIGGRPCFTALATASCAIR